MAVVVFQVSTYGGFQLASAAVNATAQLLSGEQGEQPLDQIEPGGAGWGEVQMKAPMAQ